MIFFAQRDKTVSHSGRKLDETNCITGYQFFNIIDLTILRQILGKPASSLL